MTDLTVAQTDPDRAWLVQYVIKYVLNKLWPDEQKVERFAQWYVQEYPSGSKEIPTAWDYYCLQVEKS